MLRSSRLHFIGSWKARIEALLAEQQQQQQQQRPAAKGLLQGQQKAGSGAGVRTIVHLDMDCFFAAVAAVGRPEFAGSLARLILREKEGEGHAYITRV